MVNLTREYICGVGISEPLVIVQNEKPVLRPSLNGPI